MPESEVQAPAPSKSSKRREKKKNKKRNDSVALTSSAQDGDIPPDDEDDVPNVDANSIENDDDTSVPEPTTQPNPQQSSPIDATPPNPLPYSSNSLPPTSNESVKDSLDLQQKALELTKERDELKDIVSQLQKELEAAHSDTQEAEDKYANLLGRVADIRASLAQKIQNQEDKLSEFQSHIEHLEEVNSLLQTERDGKDEAVARLAALSEQRSRELSSLKNATVVSQTKWLNEREELERECAAAKLESDDMKQIMQEWEGLAMEERSMHTKVNDQLKDNKQQLQDLQRQYDKASSDRESLSQTVDNLQRAVQTIQEERKRELRELVESHKSNTEELQRRLQLAEEAATSASLERDATKKELDRASTYEQEVKEKNLQIGSLRREAVILNDHLLKTLKYIKNQNPKELVDRQIVTNYILPFLCLDRADPKKFQILQVLASFLNWTDEQKEKAGLTRPGAPNTSSLRIPLTSFRTLSSAQSSPDPSSSSLRTPSSPYLFSNPFGSSNGSGSQQQDPPPVNLSSSSPPPPPPITASPSSSSLRSAKESLADLWSNFLEREAVNGGPGVVAAAAAAAAAVATGGGRRPSNASGVGTH